jgi:anti-anti-sigma regulatory factor
MTESISAIEVTQEQLVVIESGINSEDPDNLFASVNSHEFLEADSSEIEMNIDANLPEANSSDELVIEDVVEPVITLDATLSIQNVVKLYEKIKKSYSAYNAIEINGSRVSSIDTATLQLLVSLKKDAVKQQKEVVFVSPSPRLIESAGLLGLLEILGINA